MDFVESYKKALWEEYCFLSENVTKILLLDGKFLYMDKNEFVYSFVLSKEMGIPDSTPVTVYNDGKTISGSVVFSEGYEIVLQLKKKIKLDQRVEFSSAVHDLIKLLIEKITDEDFLFNPLVQKLVSGANGVSEDDIAKGQNKAKEMIKNNPVTVVWGPPGTGKTHTLAEIALDFFDKGKSVLIVSQSNIAVDNVMLKIKSFLNKRLEKNPALIDKIEGKVFRAGYSKIKAIMSKSNEHDFFINARQYVKKVYPDVIQELNQLLSERKETKSEEKIKETNKKIRDIRAFIHEKEKGFVWSSRILGTTISKATADKNIYDRRYDVVLFDEASMAYVPQIVYAASLAKSRFACVGDFRQLPPIVQCNEKNILNKDIFDYLGIYNESFNNHKWLVMLNSQRRMHNQISAFVKTRIYMGNLADHSDVNKNVADIVSKWPAKENSLAYLNIDDFSNSAISTKIGKTSSHANLVSAIACVLIALKAKKEGHKTVAVIAPYKNQVNLIKDILRDLNISQEDGLVSSTIHQYQGKESDVVIFDSVDANPMKSVGRMLKKGDMVTRLVNVAITRAKGKFVLVGSNKIVSGNGILSQLWQYMLKKGEALSLKEVLDDVKHPKINQWKNWQDVAGIINKNIDEHTKVTVSFNKDVLSYHQDFLTILNQIRLTQNDNLFIDATTEMSQLVQIADKVNKFLRMGIGFNSCSLVADNIFILNHDEASKKRLFIPIINRSSKEVVYVGIKGSNTINNLSDIEHDPFAEQEKLIGKAKEIKPAIKTVFELCPLCQVNRMPQGSSCCSVCAAGMHTKMDILPAYRVYLWDISSLWAKLLGEHNEVRFYKRVKFNLYNAIYHNKKIRKVSDSIKNEYYYHKNDVFNEFFFEEANIGPAIRKCGIQDWDALEENVNFVRKNMQD